MLLGWGGTIVLGPYAPCSMRFAHPSGAKPIGDDLFELRHVGKLNTRVLYFFMKGRRIILVHGIRKKTRVLTVRDRQGALERKRDWLARNRA